MSKALDPSIIDSAPIVPDEGDEGIDEAFLRAFAQVSTELESTKAELEQLKAKKSFEEVVAEMLRPYSDAVYRFVAVYCAVVGIFLLLSGFRKYSGFELSDAVLGIISGSTAISVIGLIGMVVSGLFGMKARAKAIKSKR